MLHSIKNNLDHHPIVEGYFTGEGSLMDAGMKLVTNIAKMPFILIGLSTAYPRKYEGKVCDAKDFDDSCEFDGVNNEMLQIVNIAYLAFFNWTLGFMSFPLWVIIPFFAINLYMDPSKIETGSVKNPNSYDGNGIPFYYYYELTHDVFTANVWKIVTWWNDLCIDYLHSIAYVFAYWKEYATKSGLPSVVWNRPGRYVANDLIEMWGMWYPIQVFGVGYNAFFTVSSPIAYVLVNHFHLFEQS